MVHGLKDCSCVISVHSPHMSVGYWSVFLWYEWLFLSYVLVPPQSELDLGFNDRRWCCVFYLCDSVLELVLGILSGYSGSFSGKRSIRCNFMFPILDITKGSTYFGMKNVNSEGVGLL